VVSNPEFLREGTAVFDFSKPSRIIIGTSSERAREVMRKLYAHISCPKIETDAVSAELTKYACNTFLATKISFINEVAHLSEAVGADVEAVAAGMGSDPRIGKEFLKAGPGWGGGCFPKDVRAFLKLGEANGHAMPLTNAAMTMNKLARSRVVDRLEQAMGDLTGKQVCVLGVAFKGNTDDTRESPALDIINECLKRGAVVTVYDPEARFGDGSAVQLGSPYEAAREAEAIVIATEWEEFRTLDLDKMKQAMAGNLIMDARNLLDQIEAERCGFRYLRIGRA